MISFENPYMLFLLLLIPIIVLIHYVGLITIKKKAFKFANFETIMRISKDYHIISKNVTELLLKILFIIILVLAVAGLRVDVVKRGIPEEIIFAVDASGSMLADDVYPNRLEASKEALIDVIANNSFTSEVGVLSFTSQAYVEHQLSDDILSIIQSIKDISPKETKGTSFGAVLNVAAALFHSTRSRSLILITDGQENLLSSDELDEVLRYLKEGGITLYLVGVGTTEGAPIADKTEGSSILNEKTLDDMTEDNYIIATDKEKIVSAINSFLITGKGPKEYDISFYLFMLSFIVMILEWCFANYLFKAFP
jgi:Ca-activated chloride channel homolog